MKRFMLAIAAVSAFMSCSCTPAPEYDLAGHIGCCRRVEEAVHIADAGGAYLEIGINSFLCPEEGDEVFAANLEKAKDCPVPILAGNGFYPGDIRLTGEDADLDRALDYARTAIIRAGTLGLRYMVLGSGVARRIPDGFSREEAENQFVTLLKGMGPIAAEHGITIVIEPLRSEETNFINSVREGTAICRKVNHPDICVLADFYHMAQEGEDAGAIVEAGDLLRHCHIAECEGRTCPGVHGDDFTPYFKALKEIGYEGNISIECDWEDFESQIAPAIDEMKRQIESI